MKVALVYDRINKWGGAERVLLALHKIFPDAHLFTSVYNKENAPWAKAFDIKTSFLQNFPYASSSHEFYPMLMPIAFETFSFDEYNLVISVTSEAAKGIITKPGTFHICYCLTPTRYLWSGYDEYFKDPIFRFASLPFTAYLKKWDKIAAERPDAYIAISKEVQSRIKRYYERESDLIYPPVGINFEETDQKTDDRRQINQSDSSKYYLVVSRLVPYKRVDIAIEACNQLKLPLKIIGVGSEMRNLKKIAGPTIEFLGTLTDEELVSYYRGCRALIFTAKEDFGLTVVEAQSFGKPVIAFRGGGALETIIEGKTGSFFYPQTTNALVERMEGFENIDFDRNQCLKQAEKFSQKRFEKELEDILKKRLRKSIL